jgi:hypothetical protein
MPGAKQGTRIGWSMHMAECHASFHKDGDQAKRCETKYWTWFNAQLDNGSQSQQFQEAVGCDLLSSEQNLEGFELAMKSVKLSLQ